jgi:hypothetical protein
VARPDPDAAPTDVARPDPETALAEAAARRPADGAVVEVAYLADRLRVVVTDRRARPDGPGGAVAGMRDRARLCGGTLTTHPRPDRGMRVELVLPTAARDEQWGGR